jgi:hypothetical protein
MPRSKVRGGRKAHNKRVKDRNIQVKSDWDKAVKFAYKKHEEWKASKSGETQQVSFNLK